MPKFHVDPDYATRARAFIHAWDEATLRWKENENMVGDPLDMLKANNKLTAAANRICLRFPATPNMAAQGSRC